jgi:ApaG protein
VNARQYAFAYTVSIANQGSVTAELKSRHWIITDSFGAVQEVRGEGVVGAQPVLRPGEDFEYTSWCVIATPTGTMRGSYQMVTRDGDRFDAEIAPFALSPPQLLN